MSGQTYECAFCHQVWTNEMAVRYCCDPAAYGDDDDFDPHKLP